MPCRRVRLTSSPSVIKEISFSGPKYWYLKKTPKTSRTVLHTTATAMAMVRCSPTLTILLKANATSP